MLTKFLGELAHRRYDFARYSCFHMISDWIKCATGQDPMGSYRDLRNERDARRAFLRAGGETAALASEALDALGARPVETPVAGDVVLVLAPIEHGGRVRRDETCAICVDANRFVLLTSDLGLLIAPMTVTKAWSLDTVAGYRC